MTPGRAKPSGWRAQRRPVHRAGARMRQQRRQVRCRRGERHDHGGVVGRRDAERLGRLAAGDDVAGVGDDVDVLRVAGAGRRIDQAPQPGDEVRGHHPVAVRPARLGAQVEGVDPAVGADAPGARDPGRHLRVSCRASSGPRTGRAGCSAPRSRAPSADRGSRDPVRRRAPGWRRAAPGRPCRLQPASGWREQLSSPTASTPARSVAPSARLRSERRVLMRARARLALISSRRLCGGRARRAREVLARGGVQDGARGADDEAGARARLSVHDRLRHITALRADPRHEQRHVADERAHLGQLARVGGADDQQTVAARVPAARRELARPPGRACGRRPSGPADRARRDWRCGTG